MLNKMDFAGKHSCLYVYTVYNFWVLKQWPHCYSPANVLLLKQVPGAVLS